MKCRRCKTSFDYEAHYGICPKCAAYNRLDGKDDMKTFLGEDSSYEEAYRPPVISGEGMEELDTAKKKKNAKRTASKKSGKKTSRKAVVFIVALFIIGEIISENGDDIADWLRQIYREYFSSNEVLRNRIKTENTLYSDSFSVAGRGISFGEPYELASKKDPYLTEEESLLVIPYKSSIEEEVFADKYEAECYLCHEGLFLRTVSISDMEEYYGETETGDLSYAYSDEESSLVFAGDFSDFEKGEEVEMSLSFRKIGSEEPTAIYRIMIDRTGVRPKAEWRKLISGENELEKGYSAPMISKVGSSYNGYEAKDGYILYKVTQQFENHSNRFMDSYTMSLICEDLNTYEQIRIVGEETYDIDNPISFYKLHLIPMKESGTKTTILEVPEDCKQMKATLYFGEEQKEWVASF